MMAEEKSYYMTQEGKEKIEKELHLLKTEKRKEVVERIRIARDFGDLSENSEYDSAKEEQAFVESKIAQLEKMLRNAVIIENDENNKNVVTLGRKVTFVELPDGEEETYVESGNTDIGFVYYTEAVKSEETEILLNIDNSMHGAISYPAAVMTNSTSRIEAEDFIAFLTSETAKEIFHTHGFHP